MDSIRKLILKDVETALSTVTSLESAKVGRPEHLNFPRPIAGVFPADEDTELEPEDNEVNVLNFVIRVLVDEGDEHALYQLEDVLLDIQRALQVDPTRGGLAEHTRKTGIKYLYVDAEYAKAGADLLYAVRYQSLEQDPADQWGMGS